MRIGTILIRELLVLSRRVSGYWLRAVFLGLVFLAWFIPFLIIPNDGDLILITVTIVSMVIFGLSSGLSVSDTISSERRSNTLGLLMLTPLRPIEILFGKLITGVTQFLLCLFAITPFLAIPLLSGGVTWADVLRCCLAIWAMTFLGLSVGLFWSVVFREIKNSSTATSITLLGLHLIPMLSLYILEELFNKMLYADDYFFLFPTIGLVEATTGAAFDFSRYFHSIVVLFGTGIGFIIAAYFAFRRVWRWETNSHAVAPNSHSTILGNKPTKIKSNQNRPLCINDTENPYQKLIAVFHPKQLWFRYIIYLFFICTMICVVSSILNFSAQSDDLIWLGLLLLLPLELVVRWTVAVETPHQILHDCKTGLMELLMVTPLSDKSIISGLSTNLNQFQFNRSLLLGVSHLSLFLAVLFYENSSLSWATDTPIVHFVCFIGSIMWIYLGLRLELNESSTKRFILMILAHSSLFGIYFLILIYYNLTSGSIYSPFFYDGTIIYLFLAGMIFLSFFGLRCELKSLSSIKFLLLIICQAFIIGTLASDFYFYNYDRYPFGHIILLFAFIGGSLYITYCILKINGKRLQPKRIVLLLITQLSIASGFYYLMDAALSFNDHLAIGSYFWLSCGAIILLFLGFRSRSNRWRTNRFILFAIGGLSIFYISILLLFHWQGGYEREEVIIYSCFFAGNVMLSFYELYTVQTFGLYLAARGLTHFKIILILFTINFIFPLLLLVIIGITPFIMDFRQISLYYNIQEVYLAAGLFIIWHFVRITTALILSKISSKQILNFRQINS